MKLLLNRYERVLVFVKFVRNYKNESITDSSFSFFPTSLLQPKVSLCSLPL